LKYATDEGSRVVKGLKPIHQAANAAQAEEVLKDFARKWDGKYPTTGEQWRPRWGDVCATSESPPTIRRAIHTTDAIESVNGVTWRPMRPSRFWAVLPPAAAYTMLT